MKNVAQFPTPDPVLSPNPPGAPLGLTTNPLDMDGFALHAADLLGLDWRLLTADRKEEIRQAVLVGLWMADPSSRRLLARHILGQTHDAMHSAHWRVRDCALTPIRMGLDMIMKIASGMLPDRHQAVVALAVQDLSLIHISEPTRPY